MGRLEPSWRARSPWTHLKSRSALAMLLAYATYGLADDFGPSKDDRWAAKDDPGGTHTVTSTVYDVRRLMARARAAARRCSLLSRRPSNSCPVTSGIGSCAPTTHPDRTGCATLSQPFRPSVPIAAADSTRTIIDDTAGHCEELPSGKIDPAACTNRGSTANRGW